VLLALVQTDVDKAGDVVCFRCPECNSTLTYYRIKTEDYVCRKCGNIWRNKK